jgi:hypothetical protein
MENILDYEYMIPIEALLNCSVKEYLDSDKFQFKKLRKVPLLKKIQNEREIRKLSEKLISKLEPYKSKLKKMQDNRADLHSHEMEKIKCIVTDIILEADKRKLFFDRPFLKFFIEQGYLMVAEEFIVRVEKEDSQLKAEEIYQAIRNVWIMNSLQIFWGLPLEMTPSVYAYSMLYPYTDNFLDNPEADKDAKIQFNQRLSRVLHGENIAPTGFIEEKVFHLVRQIESQYSRETYPEVFDSLGLIQEAQIESMKQDDNENLTFDEILPVSFFKGGTSVLADTFLVKGNLNRNETQFAFAYGAFLQLLDDLQDARSDKKDNHQTLFSIGKENELIDHEVRRLISYIFKVNSTDESDTQIMCLMKEVISTCTLAMVMDAAGRNPELISYKLYKELESYSKVRLPFYKKFSEMMKGSI